MTWMSRLPDGEWHSSADPAVRSAVLGPPRHAAAGLPSVGVRRTPRQPNGEGGRHRRGKGGGQVGGVALHCVLFDILQASVLCLFAPYVMLIWQ